MIAKTASIHSTAKIADNVQIGEYSIIGPDVEIGEGTIIGPHVVINGPSKIGKGNRFYQFSSIGEDPQDKKYHGEKSELLIGDNNIFREFTTVSRGTEQGGSLTSVGSHNLFMNYVHLAHDCHVGSHTVFSNNASLAGHVNVGDYANMGGFVGVHQFCNIGSYAFCAGGSIIVKDVPPFVTVSGHPASAHGLNLEGIKRHAFSSDTVSNLKKAYKLLYRKDLSLEEALTKIKELGKECQEIAKWGNFIDGSQRGITR